MSTAHDRSYLRWQMISASSYWTGLDFINVRGRGNSRHRFVLSFIPAGRTAGRKRPVPAGITKENLRITTPDGLAHPGIFIESVTYPDAEPEKLWVDVTTERAGPDESPFSGALLLAIVGIPSLDEIYSSAELRIEHTTNYPLLPDACEPEDRRWPTDVDYLSKDYESFKLLVLKYLSEHYPAWKERSEADIGVMLVELLAYAGDYLSDYQDAVATEAYLGTSRLRTSIRRHAELLDYQVSEGSTARMWIHFEVDGRFTLPQGAQILAGTTYFETMYAIDLDRELNHAQVYTWGSDEFSLRKGTTRAALVGHLRALRQGDVLIFQQPGRGPAGVPLAHAVRLSASPILDVDPLMQDPHGQPQPITVIEWFAEDRLPFDFLVASRIGASARLDVTTVLGNVVLADHGQTQEAPEPITVGSGRLTVKVSDLTWASPFSASAARAEPAAAAMVQDPRDALPAMVLDVVHRRGDRMESAARAPCPRSADSADEILDRRSRWTARRSLLDSNRYAHNFVVEGNLPGVASLRFGDDLYGRRPERGTQLQVTYRTGNGVAGNIGAGTQLTLVKPTTTGTPPRPVPVRRLTNPLPARGGTAAERIETARLNAPTRMNDQERLVIEADYVAAALEIPGVIGASAALLFNGSWYTAIVSIQRSGGELLDPSFRRSIEEHLAPRRLMGVTLDVRDARYVALDVALAVTPAPGAAWPELQLALQRVFSAKAFPDGLTGFFFPDNLHFGDGLYASQLLARALSVFGVAGASLVRLSRLGEPPGPSTEAGVVEMKADEIIQVMSDPDAPEKGFIVFRPEEAS